MDPISFNYLLTAGRPALFTQLFQQKDNWKQSKNLLTYEQVELEGAQVAHTLRHKAHVIQDVVLPAYQQ